MTRYSELLRLQVHHRYFSQPGTGLHLRPVAPQVFARNDLLLRRDGANWLVLGPQTDRPELVELCLQLEDTKLVAITQGADWQTLPQLALTLDRDDWDFADPALQGGAPVRRAIGDTTTLAHLTVTLDPEAARDLRLHINPVQVQWNYVVQGGDPLKGLSIHDPQEAVSFEPPADTELPNGARVRMLRSVESISAAARPPQRFALQQDGDFGPRTLIPVLPAPAPDQIKPGNGTPQADIYVNIG